MSSTATFDELLAEGESVPVAGWDFSWFDGRATKERPSWGYAQQMARRMATASAALDIQTGGGEVLASVPEPPPTLAATESWPPNVEVARRALAPLGASVLAVPDDAALPFPDESFDLVVSRHPTVTVWDEIARVLRPGGTYFSQQIGAASNHELSVALLGPFTPGDDRSVRRHRARAEAAGLSVVDVQEETLRVEFFDVAAIVVFLRKVIWTVPDFRVDRYRPRLAGLHERIRREGSFVCHSTRFLVEARKPRAT